MGHALRSVRWKPVGFLRASSSRSERMGRVRVDYPVWSGCFWAKRAEVPVLALSAPGEKPVVIESVAGTVLVLGNANGPMGGILLKTPPAQPSISRISGSP